MSEQQQGPGWWQASDGLWYAPELHPSHQAVQAPSPAAAPPAAYAQGFAPGAVAPAPDGMVLPAGVTVVSPWGRLGSYLLDAVLISLTLVIGWLIWAAIIGGTGQTPGKKILGQRVIVADTMRPAGLGRMFWLRGLVAGFVAGLAVMFTLGILLFMPFWDRRNQNIWDKISSCYVVNDPADAWNTRPQLT